MIEFSRHWALPSAQTFTIRPISELLKKYDVGQNWIDPFAGSNSPTEMTNDHNPQHTTKYHMEAKDFVESFIGGKCFNGALFDPPYSYRQVIEHYKVIGKKATQHDTSSQFYSRVLEPLGRLIKPFGFCISFGWNSNGIGKTRGFEIIEIMLVSHGAHHNDTIITIEKKMENV